MSKYGSPSHFAHPTEDATNPQENLDPLSQAVPRVAINKEKQLGSLDHHCQKSDSSLLRAIGCMVIQVMHIFL